MTLCCSTFSWKHAVISIGFLLIVGSSLLFPDTVKNLMLLQQQQDLSISEEGQTCQDICDGNYFGGFWKRYYMCSTATEETFCTAFRARYESKGTAYYCGKCKAKSPFVEFPWTTACSDSPYDFVGTLIFCHNEEKGTFYYVLPGTSCDTPTNTSTTPSLLPPLIRLQPGKSYQLRLQNNAHVSTNIHTHGLHISGDGNADDITRSAPPDECLYYNYTIPANHMDGTFWYHSHIERYTREQVEGGALGVLIVDPPSPDNEEENRPGWVVDREHERILLLSSNRTADFANGEHQHRVSLQPNQWYRLRIVVADPYSMIRNIVFPGDDDDGACDIRHVASDGVWHTTMMAHDDSNKRNRTTTAAFKTFPITGANRIDVAIQCQRSSGLWYRVTTPEDMASTPPKVIFDVEEPPYLSSKNHAANGDRAPPFEAWTPPRPDYLQDLKHLDLEDTFTVHISKKTGINGQLYDPITPLAVFEHNQTQQWRLYDTDKHPFHLHVHHMQVVEPGGCGNGFEYGEWYDSISAAPGRVCTVRFRIANLGGRTTLHCHYLDHEDMGVMGWVDVRGALETSSLQLDSQQCIQHLCALE